MIFLGMSMCGDSDAGGPRMICSVAAAEAVRIPVLGPERSESHFTESLSPLLPSASLQEEQLKEQEGC